MNHNHDAILSKGEVDYPDASWIGLECCRCGTPYNLIITINPDTNKQELYCDQCIDLEE